MYIIHSDSPSPNFNVVFLFWRLNNLEKRGKGSITVKKFVLLLYFVIDCRTGLEFGGASSEHPTRYITLRFPENKEYGFGFVSGQRNGKLFVVTAAHVVTAIQEEGGSINLKFFNDYEAYTGKILRYNENLDVALLEVIQPEDFSWETASLGIPKSGDAVAFIGRNRTWYIPKGSALGTINEISGDGMEIDITSVTATQRDIGNLTTLINFYGCV